MDDHDRISQASSVATISYFPVIKESDGKVQTFGKRCQAAKRDPNCPVVIRGWLNKKDSSGLKLWKRRWFVLSNYCLYYYKDSREESVLGSIPLPSYKILFCTPRECKNRKFTFKVVHQGMRSYFFSADTQEDMLGWVRALSQSASMETEGSLNRRCSSYQDFTKLGGSSESVDLAKPTSDGECTPLKHRHISRTLSEPSQLTGGRMGTMHPEHRGRRGARQRRSRTPSPADFNRRAVCRPEQEEDSLPGGNTSQMQAEMMGLGCLTPRGHLGSRPHTPVGRVDIRPHDESIMVPQTPYYTPASPKLEFKSSPTTPERWQNPNKPSMTYGSVHHVSSGRRPLGKSYSAGAHADLLPPLPPPSRASHAPPPLHQHHHHRSNFSVCVLPPAMAPKPDLKETPPIRPFESDADAVLTRLCGCDKLLQSLSVQLAQLQMDKDGVHCALDVSRLQLEKWKNQESRAQEEALTQKALLQEELVTIRARMCDVSMEMEIVWNQYERMESELSVIHSHLQHICNFGLPQEQSQAQRELWMMEDILAGLKINRDHFCFLLGLQRRHMFQQTAPHSGSPGSPTDMLHSGLPMDEDQEPPVRPPLPQELLESHQGTDRAWTQSPYEGIYSHTVDHRRGNSQPDLLNVKAQKDTLDSQSGSKWIPPHATSQSTKKIKMSEEEQIERMKRNQERLINRKKHSVSTLSAQRQSQCSETTVEAPFPLRVTRVVTAVLPSSLMARRVAVEDPPPELSNPLPEQIQPEVQQRSAAQNKKTFNRSPRCLLLESPGRTRSSAEMHQDQAGVKTVRQQRDQAATGASMETQVEAGRAEPTETSRDQAEDHKTVANERVSMDTVAEEQTPALLAPDRDADLGLTPEQREAKLRRVERIRERVIRSAARERASTNDQQPSKEEGKDANQVPPDVLGKHRLKADHESFHGSCGDNVRRAAELQLSGGTSQEEDENQRKQKNQLRFGMKTQHKGHSGRTAVTKAKIKRPGSPYHLSCMTVYQKDGGKGSVHCKDEDEQNLEDLVTGDNENNHSSSSARAKWFLSTNQWQGFVPLQIPSIDSAPNEEISDTRKLTDDVPDSNEMSSAVSQSLEKMKENHLLFYKIACDISISDTDITKNDGNSNGRGSPRPEEEEEEEVVITESGREATHVLNTSSHQENSNSSPHLPSIIENNASINNSLQDSTGEMSPATEVCVDEKTHQNIHEDTLRQEDKDPENIHGAPGQEIDCDVDGNAKTRYVKAKEDGKSEQKRSKEMKKCSSLSEENKEKQECSITASGSVCEGRSVMRSASFGKARVTVLRTSL